MSSKPFKKAVKMGVPFGVVGELPEGKEGTDSGSFEIDALDQILKEGDQLDYLKKMQLGSAVAMQNMQNDSNQSNQKGKARLSKLSTSTQRVGASPE